MGPAPGTLVRAAYDLALSNLAAGDENDRIYFRRNPEIAQADIAADNIMGTDSIYPNFNAPPQPAFPYGWDLTAPQHVTGAEHIIDLYVRRSVQSMFLRD